MYLDLLAGGVCSIGTILLLIGLIVWLVETRRAGHRRRIAAAPRPVCGGLSEYAPGMLVVVHGTTGPGPSGPAVSAGWDVPCVWWRVRVVHVTTDAEGHTHRRTIGSYEWGPFSLTDETGSVLVDPGVAAAAPGLAAELHGAVDRGSVAYGRQGGPLLDKLVSAGLAKRPRRSGRFEIEELSLVAGAPVTVVAVVQPGPAGPILVRRGAPGFAVRQTVAALDEALAYARGGTGRVLVAVGAAATVVGLAGLTVSAALSS